MIYILSLMTLIIYKIKKWRIQRYCQSYAIDSKKNTGYCSERMGMDRFSANGVTMLVEPKERV